MGRGRRCALNYGESISESVRHAGHVRPLLDLVPLTPCPFGRARRAFPRLPLASSGEKLGQSGNR